jgi:hypothetical protein
VDQRGGGHVDRTTGDATVKRYNDIHDQPRSHPAEGIDADTLARRRKTLSDQMSDEDIGKNRTPQPDRVIAHQIHQMPGLSTRALAPDAGQGNAPEEARA